MLLYEVNLEVEEDINYKVAGWLTTSIEKILTFKGFKMAYWFFRKGEDENTIPANKTLWTIQYIVEDRTSLDAYLNEKASLILKEATDQFGDKIKTTSRTLYLLNILGMPADLASQASKG